MWARGDAAGASFEARVGAAHGLGWPIAAVAILLVGVVSAAVLGDRFGDGRPPSGELRPAAAVASSPASPPEVGFGSGMATRRIEPVELATPGRRPSTPITAYAVAVRGELRLRAASLRVLLVSEDLGVLASTYVVLPDDDGGVGPSRTRVVDVTLLIPDPRPIGRAWVEITAFDRLGEPMSAMRRQVVIGELLPKAPPP